jgi:hypothetical protein
MTVTAEGAPITLDAPERGFRRFTPNRILKNMLGGLGGLAGWEMFRDRLARGIENADFGPYRALRVLPEDMREQIANLYDETKLTADDLPGNVHDFARMVAAQAITKAGPDADLNRGGSGTPIPYPTQGFAAEHFDPSLMDMLAGKIIGTNVDPESAEAIGFTDPSGWGATFGQGTMFEDPEGNIHMIDRYNFPNMTAGQVPGREENTSTQFSDYARGLGPHEGEQFREDMRAFWGDVDPDTGEKRPLGRRATNMARHYMSEFGSTETDPTEGRSWDINLGPREELLAAYAAANDPQPSRLVGWLRDLGGGTAWRRYGDDKLDDELDDELADELAVLNKRAAGLRPGVVPDPTPDLSNFLTMSDLGIEIE